MSYACGQIAALKTSRHQDLDSKEGLKRQIQTAITDPAFSDIVKDLNNIARLQKGP